jgi:acyl-CoA dehydrogenase
MTTPAEFEALRLAVKSIASQVAAKHAADVDARGRFPQETIDALKAAKVLSAPVPASHGGAGLNLHQLSVLCATISGACGSSGMVLAMHYIQVGCITRHALGSAYLDAYQREIVEAQPLLASITSEVGTYGDTRSSICAVERHGDRYKLDKQATTGSYCLHADAILVTCRRDADAPKSDQLLVLVKKSDAQLTQTTTWDTMGMRGTCSPGFDLKSAGAIDQILPAPYGDIAAETMVPYSHIMWSALWWGIAADAVSKAAAFVRGEARKNPGTVPQTAQRLAEVQVMLQAMKHNWVSTAQEFDQFCQQPNAAEKLLGIGWALKMNNLKVGCSEMAPQIVHKALQIVGILGYKNDSPFALSRHYRDALSGALMISNDRVLGKSASMLLVFKDDE